MRTQLVLTLATLTALAKDPAPEISYPPDYGSELIPLLSHPLVDHPAPVPTPAPTPKTPPNARRSPPRAIQAKPITNPCEKLTREAQGFIASTVDQILMREDPTSANYWETAGAMHRQTLQEIYPECYEWLTEHSSLGKNRYHGN